MKTRLLRAVVGGVLGFGLGILFLRASPSPLPFPLFLPATFAAVCALVSCVAAEQMFPVLLEVVIGFCVLGGGAFLWQHFAL